MLAVVYDAFGEKHQKRKAASQISQIKLHPQLPGLWIRLADTFQLMDQPDVAESYRRLAKRLFEATEKSLPESFFKRSMQQSQEEESTQNDDFTDLGSSKLRQKKEEEIEKRSRQAKQQNHHPPCWLENDQALLEFIQSFIDECANK